MDKSVCPQTLLFLISLRGRERHEWGKSFSWLLGRRGRAAGEEQGNHGIVSAERAWTLSWGTWLEKGFAAMQVVFSPILVCPFDSCWQQAELKPSSAGSGSVRSLLAGGKDGETRRRLQMDLAWPSFTALGWSGHTLHCHSDPC